MARVRKTVGELLDAVSPWVNGEAVLRLVGHGVKGLRFVVTAVDRKTAVVSYKSVDGREEGERHVLDVCIAPLREAAAQAARPAPVVRIDGKEVALPSTGTLADRRLAERALILEALKSIKKK